MTVNARNAIRCLLAGLLGVACSLLVACGSSGKLIPSNNAGPLTSDFDAIAQDVASGDCTATRRDLAQAQHDLNALPSTVDAGLRQRISDGLNHLQSIAPTQCAQGQTSSSASTTSSTPATTTNQTSSSTTTTTPPTSSSTSTTTPPPTTTSTTPSTSTPSTTTPSTSTGGTAGGTPAPQGNGAGGGAGAGNGQ